MRENEYDVLIAGGGPVGLMLATELRTQGISTAVLERLAPGEAEPRLLTLHTRTLDVLDRRGLLEELTEAARREPAHGNPPGPQGNPPGSTPENSTGKAFANPAGKAVGHFAGFFALGLGTAAGRHRRLAPSRAAVEAVLLRRARASGAVVRHGVQVTGLDQDDGGVTVSTTDGELRAAYAVGCDGGRSTVRGLAGIGFSGTEASAVSLMALATVTGGQRLPAGWLRTGGGWFMRMPDGRIATTEWGRPTPQHPPTAAEFEDSLHRVTGERVALTDVRFVSRFTDSARLADRYRSGRVLLAGDAAHVHFPAGGQGVNLGIQDAVNLGWKLAAALRGHETLLDTYESERRPVAERVLRNTRAQIALMRPDPQVDALRDLFAALLEVPEVNDRLTAEVHGTDVHYPGDGDDPRTGRFVPDRTVTTESGERARLAELLRCGRPLLLDATGEVDPDAWTAHGIRVIRTVKSPAVEALLTLIRPDGHLAWAGDAPTEALHTAVTAVAPPRSHGVRRAAW